MSNGKILNHSDENRSFEVEFQKDGIFITVAKKDNDVILTYNAINKFLNENNVKNVDRNALNNAIENLETKVCIATLNAPSIDIYVLEGDMSATACITGNATVGDISKDEVLKELSKAGIIYGISDDAIDNVLNNLGKTYTVAQGKLPVDGTDAQIDFKYDISKEKGKPKELSGGRVDYKNLDLFTVVQENEVVAEKIPATKGEDGSTIKGKLLKSIVGRDKRIKNGKNIIVNENIYISKIAGHLIVTNDKIEVLPVLELNSDIDLSTGNINFPGNVLVKGNVTAGFFVKAQGNVIINGSIFGGTVEGSNIEVKHGIQGTTNSIVKAVENISSKFIENAVVYSGGNVVVADAILHSKVSAGKKVLLSGSKGLIAGGQVSAGEEVNAKLIGTQMAPPTIIEVGVNPVLKEEYMKLRTEYKETVEKQESIKKSLAVIKPMESSTVPPERQEIYMKLTKTNFIFLGRIEEMKERLLYIEDSFNNLSHGKVKCSSIIYPGVKLIINNIVYPVRDEQQFVSFYVSDDEIKTSPYS